MTVNLSLRPLTEDDTEGLQHLLQADPGYARRVTGAGPTPDGAIQLLTGRPPGLPPAEWAPEQDLRHHAHNVAGICPTPAPPEPQVDGTGMARETKPDGVAELVPGPAEQKLAYGALDAPAESEAWKDLAPVAAIGPALPRIRG